MKGSAAWVQSSTPADAVVRHENGLARFHDGLAWLAAPLIRTGQQGPSRRVAQGLGQSSMRPPSSTTRPDGIPKYSVADRAFLDMNA